MSQEHEPDYLRVTDRGSRPFNCNLADLRRVALAVKLSSIGWPAQIDIAAPGTILQLDDGVWEALDIFRDHILLRRVYSENGAVYMLVKESSEAIGEHCPWVAFATDVEDSDEEDSSNVDSNVEGYTAYQMATALKLLFEADL